MILNNLKLSNYKQYSHLELEFREGLVGIIGKNGAGKSTIFEAILYCLFGRDEGNKAHVRSAFADPKATVELQLDFMIGEIGYRVRREFRGKALAVGAEFYKNDVLVAKSVSPVNDELVKVLHMERDAFKRSVFSGQKELSELSDTSGEARKRMVRRMLGLDTLDDAQSRVNTDLRDLSSQAAGQRQNLLSDDSRESLKSEMAEREKALETNSLAVKNERQILQGIQEKHRAEKEKFDQEETRFKRHSTLRNELAQADERRAGLILQVENLKKKEADLHQQKATQDNIRAEFTGYEAEKKAFDALEHERSKHINREARLTKIAETSEQLAATVLKIKTLAEQSAERPSIASALVEKQKSVANLEAEMETKRGDLRSIDQQIGGIQAGVRERSEKLERLRALGSEGNCPTCLQPLLDGYERALAELENEIIALQTKQLQQLEVQKKTVTEAGLSLKTQQATTRLEAEKLLQEQTRLTEVARQQTTEENQKRQLESRLTADETILREIGEVHFDEAAYQSVKAKLAAQEPRYREFLSQENYLARELPATLSALKSAESGIAEAGQKIATLTAELATVGYDEQAYNLAKQAVTNFTEAFQAQTETLRALEKTGLELQNEQSKSTEKLRINERILAQISDKLEEVELLRRLTEMLGLFKTEILEKVSPGISLEASDLFNRITKGKYEGIRVDENFDFAITDGGIFYPIERFSGGEVDLANFCLRIAITKAIMDLSGSSAERRMEFLAFDEIFGSQDEERRMEMMLALNYLQEQFRQIYIVSHIDSLKDFFPHLLEVQFAAEGSTAVWR
ncbi:MAG: SMC family ATPase [Phycisphaerae bacterium]|nr:SMC family ATPase [Saprospiraceae bacterium]